MNDPVDWELAERIAVRVAGSKPGPPWNLRAVTDDVEAAALDAEPLVERWTGLRSANGPARVEVITRAQWAAVNVRGFQRLLGPLTQELAPKLKGPASGLTRRMSAMELGTVLGWLSQRVLGQYDLLLAGDGATATGGGDTVYLVGPNLVGLETRFGFPPEQFRRWVMLHELTHRAQFTGVPWMHAHYLGLVSAALSLADVDGGHLLRVARESLLDRDAARARMDEGGLASLFATPAQRPALAQINGLMALLEGHGDHTMNRAGPELVPQAGRFAAVLAARREHAGPLARRLQRLIGLEAKLNQYASGLRFIETIDRAFGDSALGERAIDRCWEDPSNLPTIEEIRQPSQWLARTGSASAVA